VTPGSGGKLLLAAAAIIVAAVVIASIVVLGPPSAQRQRRLDAARVADLATIERLVGAFVRVHKVLPHDLGALAAEPGFRAPRNDPDSGAPYEYATLSTDSYSLCATFTTAGEGEAPFNTYGPSADATWAHGVGHQCFIRHADIPSKSAASP
jgi:hypothetical protein